MKNLNCSYWKIFVLSTYFIDGSFLITYIKDSYYLMVMNHEIIIFTPIFIVLIGFTVFSILKKRKRSAKSIYKLIDNLEKKYIY